VHINIITLKAKPDRSENYRDIDLVFAQYDTIYGKYKKNASGLFGIALLQHDTTQLNKYGIYTKFITAGVFICKAFEYAIQCRGTISKKCGNDYTFVGNRYDRIFPFNAIAMGEKTYMDKKWDERTAIRRETLKLTLESAAKRPGFYRTLIKPLFRSSAKGGRKKTRKNKNTSRRRRI